MKTKMAKLVDKSASLQHVRHCIRDWRWTMFRQIIKTSLSASSIFVWLCVQKSTTLWE